MGQRFIGFNVNGLTRWEMSDEGSAGEVDMESLFWRGWHRGRCYGSSTILSRPIMSAWAWSEALVSPRLMHPVPEHTINRCSLPSWNRLLQICSPKPKGSDCLRSRWAVTAIWPCAAEMECGVKYIVCLRLCLRVGSESKRWCQLSVRTTTVIQNQKAVTDYLKGYQFPPFGFAHRCNWDIRSCPQNFKNSSKWQPARSACFHWPLEM